MFFLFEVAAAILAQTAYTNAIVKEAYRVTKTQENVQMAVMMGYWGIRMVTEGLGAVMVVSLVSVRNFVINE